MRSISLFLFIVFRSCGISEGALLAERECDLSPWRGQSIALVSYCLKLEAGAASSVLCRMGLSNGGMGMGGPQRAATAASAGPTLPRGAFLRARV